MLTFMKL